MTKTHHTTVRMDDDDKAFLLAHPDIKISSIFGRGMALYKKERGWK